MPRHPRLDKPGAAHHVFNRGLARRTVFESKEDVRYALSLFARASRAGQIRIVSYSFLTTHFHALIESVEGTLSDVMQRMMNLYVRRFNRLRRRDGPLFRGRFGSRLVESDTYRTALVRYIDQNAPQARLANTAALYPFGSAYHLVAPTRPRWLDTTWVDRVLGPSDENRLDRYVATLGSPLTDGERALVVERLRNPDSGSDSLDDLVRASPTAVREWMLRKALLADGCSPGVACAGREMVLEAVRKLRSARGTWLLQHPGLRGHDAWQLLHVGLLRSVCALAFAEIATILDISTGQAMRLNELHGKWLARCSEYAVAAAQLVAQCTSALDPLRLRIP
jgi:REP element-mobilizing transposase RayT